MSGTISVEALVAIVTIVGALLGLLAGVWKLQAWLGKQFAEMRDESSKGREKIYTKIDDTAREHRESIHRLRGETVSTDTFNHVTEEFDRQLSDVKRNIEKIMWPHAGAE